MRRTLADCRVGTVDGVEAEATPNGGDSYDNALAEAVIGLYKKELIRRKGPWHNLDHVEFGTLTWVSWFNSHRLLEPIGDIPPVEFEAAYYRNQPTPAVAAAVN